jgi:Bacteriophage tail sheath protein
LSDAVGRGITVTEIAPMDQPIDTAPETTAAFIGRALRGPLNTPVLVHHFGDFRRRFGDTWSRSSLGPAVQQFFEHGGESLYVVRVANSARGALICLPASGSALVLRTLEPGSTERIRAAVDYDGIEDEDDGLFNLTLQRVDPANGYIVDQEIFRNLSYDEKAETFVADMLLSSTMVAVEHPYPTHRPDRTTSSDSRFDPTWVGHVQDGTDGVELSDYDLVGSRKNSTGLFALEQAPHFDILYLPPRGKGVDTGAAAVLAAELYCRQRGAMLVVDPPVAWQSPADVVEGVRAFGYASPNMLSYFPRVYCRGDDAERVAGAALAGLLCKQDRSFGPWHSLDDESLGLNRKVKPVSTVSEDDSYALQRAGINVIEAGSGGRTRVSGSMTMARGSESYRVFRSLSVRRLCLRIINTIDQSTRWAVFEKPDFKLTERIRGQILTYFSCLADLGAFQNELFVVDCDAGLCQREDRLEHGITILLVFHPIGSPEPISFTIHQTVAGCRVASTAFAPVAEDCA